MKLILLLFVALISGCANSYKEPPKSTNHALLTFQESEGVVGAIGGTVIHPIEINGHPPSEWKWDHQAFRIRPGETHVLMKILGEGKVAGSLLLSFETEPGETYHVSREVRIDSFDVKVTNTRQTIVASGSAKKEIVHSTGGGYIPIFIPSN